MLDDIRERFAAEGATPMENVDTAMAIVDR